MDSGASADEVPQRMRRSNFMLTTWLLGAAAGTQFWKTYKHCAIDVISVKERTSRKLNWNLRKPGIG